MKLESSKFRHPFSFTLIAANELIFFAIICLFFWTPDYIFETEDIFIRAFIS